jgi:hypothetical protein
MKIYGNLSIKYLVLLLTMMLLSSCLGNVVQESTCSSENKLVNILTENYAEWARQEVPFGSTAVTTLRLDGWAYAIQSLQRTQDNQPILSISTNEGHPRTWIGIEGYFYTPNDELLNLSSDYTITRITEHVYCYARN